MTDREQTDRERSRANRAEQDRQQAVEQLCRSLAAATQTVLRVRGIAVDDLARARIEACTDASVLERWLARAATASAAAQLFLDG